MFSEVTGSRAPWWEKWEVPRYPKCKEEERDTGVGGQDTIALSEARLACHRGSCVTKFRVINVQLSGVSLCEVGIRSLGCEHDAWNSTATFNHELGALMVENKVDTP